MYTYTPVFYISDVKNDFIYIVETKIGGVSVVNKLSLNIDILSNGLYTKKITETAKCVRYICGSLGELVDFYSGMSTAYISNIVVVGYVQISKKDYTSLILDLNKRSNVYLICEYLINHSCLSDNAFVRVTDGTDSFLVSARGGMIDELAIVKINPFSFIGKLKNMLKL